MDRKTVVSALAQRSIRLESLCPRGRYDRGRACDEMQRGDERFLRLVIARYGNRETAQLLKESGVLFERARKARQRAEKQARQRAIKQGVAYCW